MWNKKLKNKTITNIKIYVIWRRNKHGVQILTN